MYLEIRRQCINRTNYNKQPRAHLIDHQYLDPVHLGHIHPSWRDEYYPTYFHSCIPRNASEVAVELLWVFSHSCFPPFSDRCLVRLENEHIGNTDQYRVTREVPLPYSFDEVEHESDDEADEDEKFARRKKSMSIRMPSLSRPRNTTSTEQTVT